MPGTLLNINDRDILPLWEAIANTTHKTPASNFPPNIPSITIDPPSSWVVPLPQVIPLLTLSSTPPIPPMPPTIDDPPPPHPICHFSYIPVSVSQGLLPDVQLANAISNATISGLHCKEEHVAWCTTHLKNLAESFIADFSLVCDSHNLIPTNFDLEGELWPVDEILTAISDGIIDINPSNDPSWAQALASPEWEY